MDAVRYLCVCGLMGHDMSAGPQAIQEEPYLHTAVQTPPREPLRYERTSQMKMPLLSGVGGGGGVMSDHVIVEG